MNVTRPKIKGAAVRAAREAKGLTQAQLATLAGLARPTVTRIETGKRGGDLETLIALSRALGVPVEELIPAPRAKRCRRRVAA